MIRQITTSWDDGHPLDFRIASLLDKYGLKGTFYIPRTNIEHEVMSEQEILRLSRNNEIGGHTLNHSNLSMIDIQFLKSEITGGKLWMDDLLGKHTTSFCYPKGLYSSVAKHVVKESGYTFARTVELLNTKIGDPFLAPTTLQLFQHPATVYLINPIKRKGFIGILHFLKYSQFKTTLSHLTHKILDIIEQEGGVFHLWGHSWEIEQENLWDELETIIQICSERPAFEKVWNAQI
jgi:peptidoglycan/xylan/chitin deacetylase (PgdA/CDA1 family)